jgi:S1-C subfamily serine protease
MMLKHVGTSAATATPLPTAAATATPRPTLAAEEIADRLGSSTVLIRSEFPERVFSHAGSGSGTGIVLEVHNDIYILTNSHVVQGAAVITIALANDERERSARIVATSSCDDLALLEVEDTSGLVPAPFGQSANLKIGEHVVALGFPLIDELSIASGVISRTGVSSGEFDDLIQTDTPINPGNSGGPLVNRYGEVIGINTFKLYGESIEGMNFAIAIDHALSIVDTLQEGTNRHWHGMNLSRYEFDNGNVGLIVDAVQSGSPADQVGVHPGDWLYQLEGIEVATSAEVCSVLRSRNDGDKLRLHLLRATETELLDLRATITLGTPDPDDSIKIWDRYGLNDTDGGNTTRATPTAAPQPTAAPTTFQAIHLDEAELQQARDDYQTRLARSQWILEETFDNEASKTRWRRARLQNLTYRFNAPAGGFVDPWIDRQLGSEYTVQIDVAPQTPGSMVGILYNWQDDNNWSAFMMAGEGVWVAMTMYQGEIIDLQEFDARDVILGGGNTNQIRVEHFSDRAVFWIRDAPVGVAAPGPFSGGYVGIAGRSGTIIADNMYVWTR